MLNLLLPSTEQPQGRDFHGRNLKRAERVAGKLVSIWEREGQTAQLLLGIGQRCLTAASAGGNSPAAIYCHFRLKKQDLGKFSARVSGTEKYPTLHLPFLLQMRKLTEACFCSSKQLHHARTLHLHLLCIFSCVQEADRAREAISFTEI